jgi:serine/threonine protein kinase
MKRADGDFGDYRILARLGCGGMAEVLKARRASDPHAEVVALKRILPELAGDAGFATLFRQEAAIAARLDHPAIVRVHCAGEVDGVAYIEMEWVHGFDLATLIERAKAEGQLEPWLAAYVVAEVCRALDYVHRAGLVHRDVSASNVLVGYDGRVKLSDFGIATALEGASERTKTKSGVRKGKLAYLAPELAARAPGAIAPAADLYSAGILLYEALTAERPKPTEEMAASAPFDEICRRALADRPDARFSSAGEMAAALDAVARSLDATGARVAGLVAELFRPLDHEPSLATPTLRPRRTHVTRAVVASFLLASLVAGAAFFTQRHSVEHRERAAILNRAGAPIVPIAPIAPIAPSPPPRPLSTDEPDVAPLPAVKRPARPKHKSPMPSTSRPPPVMDDGELMPDPFAHRSTR